MEPVTDEVAADAVDGVPLLSTLDEKGQVSLPEDDAETVMDKKKSRTQAIRDRRRAREEQARREAEMEERHKANIIQSSVGLLQFTKAFFDFLEALPRGEKPSHVDEGPPPSRSLEVPPAIQERNDSFINTDRPGGAEGEGSGDGAGQGIPGDNVHTRSRASSASSSHVASFCMIPSFLNYSIESFFIRLGILLRRSVGPGGVISNKRYHEKLKSMHAEYPSDVVTHMKTFLSLLVVPPPVCTDPEKLPFDFVLDDDLWEACSKSTTEWLSMINVDETIFDMLSFRELLFHLVQFPLERLTRSLKLVTKDLMSICSAAAADRSSNIVVDGDETAQDKTAPKSASPVPARHTNNGHSSESQEQRRSLIAGALEATELRKLGPSIPAHRHDVEPPSGLDVRGTVSYQHDKSIYGRRTIAYQKKIDAMMQRNKTLLVADTRNALSSGGGGVPRVTSADSSNIGRSLVAGSYGLSVPSESVIVGAKPFGEDRQGFTNYELLSPANWLSTNERAVDVEPMDFGCAVGEPPLPGTPFKVVLQCKHSHYLYTARSMPFPQEQPLAKAPLLVPTKRMTPAERQRLRAIEERAALLKSAVRGHQRPDGKVVANKTIGADFVPPPLSKQQRCDLILKMPMGAELLKKVPSTAKMLLNRRNVSSLSKAALPLPSDHPQSYSQPHMLFSRETILGALQRVDDDVARGQKITSNKEEYSRPHPKDRGGSSPTHTDDSNTVAPTMRQRFPPVGEVTEQMKEASERERKRLHTLQEEFMRRTYKRPTARLVTLQSLVGKDVRGEGESIFSYWESLQGLRFKLAVLRGGGMPQVERDLWKDLWMRVHEQIEEVFEQLKRNCMSNSKLLDPHDDSPPTTTLPVVIRIDDNKGTAGDRAHDDGNPLDSDGKGGSAGFIFDVHAQFVEDSSSSCLSESTAPSHGGRHHRSHSLAPSLAAMAEHTTSNVFASRGSDESFSTQIEGLHDDVNEPTVAPNGSFVCEVTPPVSGADDGGIGDEPSLAFSRRRSSRDLQQLMKESEDEASLIRAVAGDALRDALLDRLVELQSVFRQLGRDELTKLLDDHEDTSAVEVTGGAVALLNASGTPTVGAKVSKAKEAHFAAAVVRTSKASALDRLFELRGAAAFDEFRDAKAKLAGKVDRRSSPTSRHNVSSSQTLTAILSPHGSAAESPVRAKTAMSSSSDVVPAPNGMGMVRRRLAMKDIVPRPVVDVSFTPSPAMIQQSIVSTL